MSEAQPPTLNTMQPPHRPAPSGLGGPGAELGPGARRGGRARGRLAPGLRLAVGLWSLSVSLALSLALSLSGCSAPEGGSTRPRSPGIAGAPQVADDTFLLRVPPGLAAQARAELKQRLQAALKRRGLELRHSYSALVGLDGVISVHARAEDVQALLAELPELEARAAVLRYPLEVPCGDGRCAADEVETSRRDSTCSVDCGFVRERPLRDELSNSWQATRVNAPAVWPVADGSGVHVAVLDSGYDHGASSTHPDRPTALGEGYGFPTKSPDFSGITSHGTHVVGIIAAPKNGVGMAGIAPGATVHPLQVFAVRMGRLGAAEDDIIAAIERAVSMQAATKAPFIINMSLGGGRDSELEHEALRRAYAEGLLVVAAAGNTEDYASGAVLTAPQNFPGAYGEVLSTGATDKSDNIAGFSATGPTVDISGPGVEVYSTAIAGSGERQGRVTLTVDGMARRVTASLPEGSSATTAKDVAVTDCGFGRPSEVTACAPAGKVALVQRGPAAPGETPLPFLDKVRNARLGGAVGVLLYNHRYGDVATAGAPLDSISLGTGHPVPVAGLAAGDGEYIADRLRAGRAVSVTVETLVTDYVVFDGTSMASPAVAGVAALVWSRDRALSNVQLRQLLIESAVDLGPPGRDDLFGYGRIDAARAVAQMRPRATCGDGRLSDSSEVCDSADLGGVTCDDLGFDGVAGGSPSCDRCVRVLGTGCACLSGRTPFDARLLLSVDTTWDGLLGTLARYQIALGGKPVRGARARVQVRSGGRLLGEYETDASDSSGAILDFIPYDGTGLPAGDYTFAPVITKGSGRCRDDQAIRPASYTVKIKS